MGPIVVVKIGTSTLLRESTSDDSSTVSATAGRKLREGAGELAVSTLGLLVDTLLVLKRDGYRVILVTSGAIGVGCRELNVEKRPKLSKEATNEERREIIAQLQAYAAVGQSVLMQTYDRFMRMAHQPIAQVLLSATDLGDETAFANTQATLKQLMKMGIIPIINENDTVATEELKYGDNDWLSALVSTVINADWLFLLTDVDMLYTSNPRIDAHAKPISNVLDINKLNIDLSSNSSGTQWGVGGMNTKITAARLATAAGVKVALLHGRHPGRVLDCVYERENAIATIFHPSPKPLTGVRKKWLSHCLPPKGDIFLTRDCQVQIRSGHALKSFGVTKVQGKFSPNTAIRIRDDVTGAEIARGISRYGHVDIANYAGKTTEQISVGEPISDVIVMVEDLALLVSEEKSNGVIGSA